MMAHNQNLPTLWKPNFLLDDAEKRRKAEQVFNAMEFSFYEVVEKAVECSKIAYELHHEWKKELFSIPDNEIWRRAYQYAFIQLNRAISLFREYLKLTKNSPLMKAGLVSIEQRLLHGEALCEECCSRFQMARTGKCPLSKMLRDGNTQNEED